jgi:hypothetical protein
MKGQPDGRPRCLRCKTIDLTLLDSSTETISFFECPQCFRNYAQKRGGRLCMGFPPPRPRTRVPCYSVQSRVTSPTRLHPLIPCVPHSGLVLPSRLFVGVNAFR